MLPCHPLLSSTRIQRVLKAKLELRVIVPSDVVEDCKTFDDGVSTFIVIDYNGYAAVGIDLGEPRLFLDVLEEVDGLVCIRFVVCFLKFLQKD